MCEVRRPIADRAQDIGIWFNILDTVAKIAVISNVSNKFSFFSFLYVITTKTAKSVLIVLAYHFILR